MRKSLTVALVSVFVLTGLSWNFMAEFPARSSGDLRYYLHSSNFRPVKQEVLEDAALISDVIDGYPVNWITDYVSVEISATVNGKLIKAVSVDDVLSEAQKSLLHMLEPGANVAVDVLYKYTNPVTRATEDPKMHTVLTVVPEVEAEYVGGYPAMEKYLQENCVNRIPDSTALSLFSKVIAKFTVDEHGNIAHVRLHRTSGDPETDTLLLDAIRKMPRWKPAENKKGVKVKEEFTFGVHDNMGC